jgi:pre-mRNA-splicing factor CWC26
MSGPKADAILARHGKKRKRKERQTGIVVEEEHLEEEEEDDAVIVAERKSAGWKTLDGNVKEEVKEEVEEEVEPVRKRGGLRTAAQLRADTAIERAKSLSPPPEQQATVHRDASGRIVDMQQLEADARRREQDELDRKRQRAEWTQGLTQRRERERQEQEEAVEKSVARYADDARMNKELAQEERWNDPAASFVKVGLVTEG